MGDRATNGLTPFVPGRLSVLTLRQVFRRRVQLPLHRQQPMEERSISRQRDAQLLS